MKKNFEVVIHTDGACSGNPGYSGYAAILLYGDHRKTVSGYEESPKSTNNRAELWAMIAGIKALQKPCSVTLYTDSNYCCLGWKNLDSWLAKPDLKNRDLWTLMKSTVTAGKHTVQVLHEKGHADSQYNLQCDKLAKEQVKICHHKLLDKLGF